MGCDQSSICSVCVILLTTNQQTSFNIFTGKHNFDMNAQTKNKKTTFGMTRDTGHRTEETTVFKSR